MFWLRKMDTLPSRQLIKVRCIDCGAEFSFRVAAAALGTHFRSVQPRCPSCRDEHEASKSLLCHWCGAVAIYRAGELIPGAAIGACREHRAQLSALMREGAEKWADVVIAQAAESNQGFLDPFRDLELIVASNWRRKEVSHARQ